MLHCRRGFFSSDKAAGSVDTGGYQQVLLTQYDGKKTGGNVADLGLTEH
jgi:hypothetical protein